MPVAVFRGASVVAALLLWTGAVAGQPPNPAIDVQALGPQVGTAVPPFTLQDQSGTPRTLQSVMGPRGAVLVFFRSADW